MVDLVQKFPEFVDRLPGMKAVTSTRITTIERIATWWMMIVATYLIYGQLWGQTVVDHWGEGGVPEWFRNPTDGLPPGFLATPGRSWPRPGARPQARRPERGGGSREH